MKKTLILQRQTEMLDYPGRIPRGQAVYVTTHFESRTFVRLFI